MENIEKEKIYEGIAGCVIAFGLAIIKYGTEACVSLVPKTKLIEHYKQKYHLQRAGWQLYIEGRGLNKLLKKYFL